MVPILELYEWFMQRGTSVHSSSLDYCTLKMKALCPPKRCKILAQSNSAISQNTYTWFRYFASINEHFFGTSGKKSFKNILTIFYFLSRFLRINADNEIYLVVSSCLSVRLCACNNSETAERNTSVLYCDHLSKFVEICNFV